MSAIFNLFWDRCFGDGGATFLVYDYLELYGANAQNTYRRTSRIVRGQPTLKNVIVRYFWNGLSRERLKVRKALYTFKAMKALYALYAKYANVLVE